MRLTSFGWYFLIGCLSIRASLARHNQVLFTDHVIHLSSSSPIISSLYAYSSSNYYCLCSLHSSLTALFQSPLAYYNLVIYLAGRRMNNVILQITTLMAPDGKTVISQLNYIVLSNFQYLLTSEVQRG